MPAPVEPASSSRLSVLEKVGYGLGDAASHIVLDNVVVYMTFFYTDVFGLPAAFVGTMFLLARALDAVSDPLMGMLADRTRTRWGKFRPYLLWGALPFGLLCVLAYTTPAMNSGGKLVFATLTYTALTLIYTVVNIPYCALGGVITEDPVQRVSLQSYRFCLATFGGLLSTVAMPKLVQWVDATNPAIGYRGAIAILAAVAVVMLLVCFATTRERINPAGAGPGTWREDLRDIWRNDQWRIVAALIFLNILGYVVRGGMMLYYVTYVLGDAGAMVAFMITFGVGNILGSAVAKPLSDRFCKVALFTQLNVVLAVLSAAMFFVPAHATGVMFAFIFVIGVLHQATTPYQWVMMSDTVDYGEWKQGKRLTGVNFAGTLFVLKLGLALGGAVIGWTLGYFGYVKDMKVATPAISLAIVALFTLFPAVIYLLSALVSRGYTLRREPLAKMLAELAVRRGQTSA